LILLIRRKCLFLKLKGVSSQILTISLAVFWLNNIAKVEATIDFPTPPLPETTAIFVFLFFIDFNYFPESVRNMIKSYGADFVDISSPTKISDFVFSTGELYGPPKEQSLVINSKKGLIVITGCAHPGIVNIVKKAKEMFPEKNIYLVLGGFHFPPAKIISEFKNLKVEKVAPSHCSGDKIRELFKQKYKENLIENGVGKIIKINEK